MKRAACTIAAALLAVAAPAQDRVTVLQGARLHTGQGQLIDNAVLVFAGGKVQTVGDARTPLPAGAQVIDAGGRVVTPGLVDAATTLGVRVNDANEQGSEVTPHLRIVDAVNPADKAFARARRRGVTTVQVSPGNRNVIGGLGAVLKTHGATVADMLLRDASCLRVTLGTEPGSGNRAIRGGVPSSIYYRRPTTRMGVVWAVREAFYEALAYRDQKTVRDANGHTDPALEVLLQAIDGNLQVRTTARAEQDIRTALRLAGEFGYRPVLEEATEAWRAVDAVAQAKVTLVFGAPSALAGHGDDAQARLHTLNVLAAEKVPFAIATGSHVGADDLLREAMFAVRNGLDPQVALAAITRVPAEVLGVADRVGALAPGRDADFVVWSGDPFDPTTTAQAVYIDGAEVTR
jgi:imidazolonepropionase-like amidohydrolase